MPTLALVGLQLEFSGATLSSGGISSCEDVESSRKVDARLREKGIHTPMALVVPLNQLGDHVHPDHLVVNKELFLSLESSCSPLRVTHGAGSTMHTEGLGVWLCWDLTKPYLDCT